MSIIDDLLDGFKKQKPVEYQSEWPYHFGPFIIFVGL